VLDSVDVLRYGSRPSARAAQLARTPRGRLSFLDRSGRGPGRWPISPAP